MCTHCTRRQFLEASTLGSLALATGHLTSGAVAADTASAAASKVRICVMIAGEPAEQKLEPFRSGNRGRAGSLVRRNTTSGCGFVIGQTNNAEQAARLLAEAGPDAPYWPSALISLDRQKSYRPFSNRNGPLPVPSAGCRRA